MEKLALERRVYYGWNYKVEKVELSKRDRLLLNKISKPWDRDSFKKLQEKENIKAVLSAHNTITKYGIDNTPNYVIENIDGIKFVKLYGDSGPPPEFNPMECHKSQNCYELDDPTIFALCEDICAVFNGLYLFNKNIKKHLHRHVEYMNKDKLKFFLKLFHMGVKDILGYFYLDPGKQSIFKHDDLVFELVHSSSPYSPATLIYNVEYPYKKPFKRLKGTTLEAFARAYAANINSGLM